MWLVRSLPILIVASALLPLLVLAPADDASSLSSRTLHAAQPSAEEPRDPAAWGDDHVGKSLPDYMTGEECLFCHRDKIGPTWQENRHYLSFGLHDSTPEAMAALQANQTTKPLAADVQYVMGGEVATRFLKRSEAYGKLDLLSAACITKQVPGDKDKQQQCTLAGADDAHWNPTKFADSCVGCHATAVDAESRAYASVGFDCYVCHGDVDPEHADDTSLVHLSKERDDSAAVVVSICGQCHIRTGTSRSTELPYPNQFVAGDNLFRDFAVDFSDEALAKLNPGDRHVLENVRDVVIQGQTRVTCLSCHNIHEQSSRKHQRISRSRHLCVTCHYPTGPKSKLKAYEVHSETCEY